MLDQAELTQVKSYIIDVLPDIHFSYSTMLMCLPKI